MFKELKKEEIENLLNGIGKRFGAKEGEGNISPDFKTEYELYEKLSAHVRRNFWEKLKEEYSLPVNKGYSELLVEILKQELVKRS